MYRLLLPTPTLQACVRSSSSYCYRLAADRCISRRVRWFLLIVVRVLLLAIEHDVLPLRQVVQDDVLRCCCRTRLEDELPEEHKTCRPRQSACTLAITRAARTYRMRGVASGRGFFQPRMLAIVGYTSVQTKREMTGENLTRRHHIHTHYYFIGQAPRYPRRSSRCDRRRCR